MPALTLEERQIKSVDEGALGRVLGELAARRGLRGLAAGMRSGLLGRRLADFACLALHALRSMVVPVALASLSRGAELAGVQGLVGELAFGSRSTKVKIMRTSSAS